MTMPDGTVPLACFDTGSGTDPPLILLHGFPLDHGMWRPQINGGVAARVIAPDLRGFGASPPGAPTDLDGMARDVLALADRLGLHRFILGGFSMGNDVAFALCSRAPERVRGLVLASAQAEPDSPKWRERHTRTAKRVRESGVEALFEETLPFFFTSRTMERDPGLVAAVKRMILDASVDGAVNALRAIRDQPDYRPILPRVRCPTLVIVGEDDEMTPLASSEAIAQAVPDARLVTVPGSAHATTLEKPGVVNAALRGFVRDLTGP